jgi:hypothetical protein
MEYFIFLVHNYLSLAFWMIIFVSVWFIFSVYCVGMELSLGMHKLRSWSSVIIVVTRVWAGLSIGLNTGGGNRFPSFTKHPYCYLGSPCLFLIEC